MPLLPDEQKPHHRTARPSTTHTATRHSFSTQLYQLFGPFPLSAPKNCWTIVAVDYFTRYAETKAVPTASTREVADFIFHFTVLRHGAPQAVISDHETPFHSKVLAEVLQLPTAVHNITSAYHHHPKGLMERRNHTLATMLSMYVTESHTN